MQFKITSIAAIALLAYQGKSIAITDPASPNELVARSCDFSDPCYAAKGTREGVYCGVCPEILGHWNYQDAYNLYPDGSCCNYGWSQPCADLDGNQCPRANT